MDLDLGKEEWGFLTYFRSCRVSKLLSVLSGSQGSHPLAGRVLLATVGLGTSSRAGRLLPVGAATLHLTPKVFSTPEDPVSSADQPTWV